MEKKKVGRPRGSGSGGGKAPENTHENHSVSLPKEYGLYFDRRTPDELKHLPQPERENEDRGRLRKAFLEVAEKQYSDSRQNAAIFRYALDELWRRRHEPTAEEMAPFVDYGIAGVVADFDAYDFADAVRSSKSVTIMTPNLAPLLKSPETLGALTHDMGSRKIVICTHADYDLSEKRLSLSAANYDALYTLYRSLAPTFRASLLQDMKDAIDRRVNNYPSLLLVGLPKESHYAGMRILVTDTIAVASTSHLAVQVWPHHPAMVYCPSKNRTTVERVKHMHLENHSPTMTVQTSAPDFYSLYAIAASTIPYKHGKDLMQQLWEKFESERR